MYEISKPERLLWGAVLLAAVEDLNSEKLGASEMSPGARMAVVKDTKHWFLDDNNKEINSFRGICDVLGLDPHATRLALGKWLL